MNTVEKPLFLELNLSSIPQEKKVETCKLYLNQFFSLENKLILKNKLPAETIFKQLNIINFNEEELVDSEITSLYSKITSLYRMILTNWTLDELNKDHRIKVKISQEQGFEIPRNLLYVQSKELCEKINQESILDISCLSSDKDALSNFVSFLQTGHYKFINDNNAFTLLCISFFHFKSKWLSTLCLQKLLGVTSKWVNTKNQLSQDEINLANTIEKAKQLGIVYGNSGKDAFCIKNPDFLTIERLLDIHNYFPVRHVKFEKTPDLKQLLKFLSKNKSIKTLELGSSTKLNDNYLKKISIHLPDLVAIELSSKKITEIPLAISGRLKKINFKHCTNLKRFSAPKATEVVLDTCSKLTDFDAHKAEVVRIKNCSNFEGADIPLITYFESLDCPKLSEAALNQIKGIVTFNKLSITVEFK